MKRHQTMPALHARSSGEAMANIQCPASEPPKACHRPAMRAAEAT